MSDHNVPSLEPESFDFMALVAFLWKSESEGSFQYTWENYPPIFRTPELRALETDIIGFRRLLDAHRKAISRWEGSIGGQRACDLHNVHIREAREERDSRRLWAVRFANGNISCERSEEAARRLGSNDSWGYPAILKRESAAHPWVEVAALGPKDEDAARSEP